MQPEHLGEDLPAGRYTYDSPCREIRVVIDTIEFEFYMEASGDAEASNVADTLDTFLHARGLELIPEDECPADILDSGWTRVYATPVRPVADGPNCKPEPHGLHHYGRMLGFGSLGIFSGMGAAVAIHSWFLPTLDTLTSITGGSA